MSERAKRLQTGVDQIRRVDAEVMAALTAAEDALIQHEDRETRRATRRTNGQSEGLRKLLAQRVGADQ
jgi:hypothetical protein